jgi:NDP-sugar pyrophosphorylase family protein
MDQPSSLVAVVLAAGGGTRLRPLTSLIPKALCPVNNVPLVDLAFRRVGEVTREIAVNIHHFRELMEEHLAGRAPGDELIFGPLPGVRISVTDLLAP